MKALGVDIGTTTISAAVLDRESGKVCEAKTVANQSFIDTGNEWERVQDVAKILQKAVAVTDEMLDAFDDITSIGLTGQMHGILYCSKEGECVSPLYTWQDGRGNLPGQGGNSLVEEIFDKTGLSTATGYGMVTHLYNLRNGLVPEEAASLCTIGDYLGMRLTGRRAPLMHASNAASTGLFDVAKGDWKKETLGKMGMMDLSLLPKVTGSFEELGEHRGVRVTVAVGDNQASFLGSAGLKVGAVLVNMGTGGQISVLSDQLFEAPLIEARPIVPGRYLLAGSSLCGGRAYAILEKFFRSFAKAAGAEDAPQYELLGRLAREGMELEDPALAVTTFSGTRQDPTLRGSILNISEDNFTPASVTYAVLRGMAQELFGMYETISKGTGIRAEHLIASGNGLRMNPALQDIFKELFCASLSLSPYKEEAASGAAISSYTEV